MKVLAIFDHFEYVSLIFRADVLHWRSCPSRATPPKKKSKTLSFSILFHFSLSIAGSGSAAGAVAQASGLVSLSALAGSSQRIPPYTTMLKHPFVAMYNVEYECSSMNSEANLMQRDCLTMCCSNKFLCRRSYCCSSSQPLPAWRWAH